MAPVTFPLLKLPLLTIKNVVRSMKMEELFDLSHCSKKTQRYLKACYGKNLQLCVQISGDSFFSIYLEKHSDCFKIHLKNDISGSNQYKTYETRKFKRTIQLPSSQTLLEGVTSIVHHFLESFDLEIGELFINLDSVENQFCTLLQSVLKQQKTLKNMNISGLIDRKDLKYLLENYTITDSFVAELDVDFPYNMNLNTDIIRFSSAGWLTVSNLLSMSFKICEWKEAFRFQLNDLVTVLSAWKNGWNPKMHHLEIDCNVKCPSIESELPFGAIREKSVSRHVEYFALGAWRHHTIKGGWDITRDDGKVATVYNLSHFWNSLKIHVWDGTEKLRMMF